MTATAVGVTEVATSHHWLLGTGDKKKRFIFAADGTGTWVAAGVALDLSAYFTAITEQHWGPGIVVTDYQVLLGLFGTDAADGQGGITASTVLVAAYGTKNTTSGDDVLAPPAGSLTAITGLRLTVHGY